VVRTAGPPMPLDDEPQLTSGDGRVLAQGHVAVFVKG
jgi:hypothetical protein